MFYYRGKTWLAQHHVNGQEKPLISWISIMHVYAIPIPLQYDSVNQPDNQSEVCENMYYCASMWPKQ